MEDEIQKRNTDCVYFLASPLTCKKGSECEFRHSENARLNPRDCYYWLSGNCINPNCPFRHPPLEGLAETGSEPVHASSNAAIPTSKSIVPCYFYFNAYCIKGDHCPFLHDILPAQKNLKAPLQTTTADLPEKKASTGSDTGPASIEVPANLPGGALEPIKQEHFKEVSEHPATDNALDEPSPSAESSVPECDEPPIKLSDENPLPATEYGSPQLCLDQGSEDLVKECAEPDEWWESSPGFDVLVDDGSDHLPYDDDADYMMARERESDMLHEHGHLLPYDYELPAGYDPIGYPDAGYMYEHGMYDSYNRAENNRYTPEYFQREHSRERSRSRGARYSRERSRSRGARYSRERSLDVVPHRKRIPPRRKDMVDRRDSVDLRDHLRKRMRTDGSPLERRSSCSRGSSGERAMRRPMGPLLGRLGSEVGNMAVSSHDTIFSANDSHQRGWSGYPQSSRHSRHVQSRLREREVRRRNNRKPPPERSFTISSEITQVENDAANFSGPKTLAQIKEEKRRAAAAKSNDSECYVPPHEDFEGPKPLNELLKDKRRPSQSNAIRVTKEEVPERSVSGTEKELSNVRNSGGDGENQNARYKRDFLDDGDDIDDDTFHRKLAGILSS